MFTIGDFAAFGQVSARMLRVTLQFDPDNPANWVHEFQIPVTR